MALSTNQENLQQLTPLQRAVLALKETRSQLDAHKAAQHEPLAIIGIGCRFPGSVHDVASYWQLLRDGIDAISEVPPDRWDIDALFDPDPDAPGKISSRYGGFLESVDGFDPHFFGISPREAISMDPQQRLLLQVAWEALEHAGLIPAKLSGSKTGVFVGATAADYLQLLKQEDREKIDPYYLTGNCLNVIAGRLSYFLGVHGPSMAVDTACSSSLTAVHLACQSLRAGECNMALAGGVNIMLSPEMTISASRAHMLAADGRCKTFDARADGFVRGEGCGVIVLKRLSEARAQGDRIIAVIRGSAINQDGPSSGLTVPNSEAQQALIRAALQNAQIAPHQVQYVEAHGTGTSLGDPIEVRALGEVLREGRGKEQPLMIGSVKTNFGHLESAAGIAGLIKAALSLYHNEIPPHLHFQKINPDIPLEEINAAIPTQRMVWPAWGTQRLAGVSAFGVSGTNVHVVLEGISNQYSVFSGQSKAFTDNCSLKTDHCIERPLHVLTLSAKSEKALKELATRYERHLAEPDQDTLADICYSSHLCRSHFEHRAALSAASTTEMRQKLAALISGEEIAGLVSGQVPLKRKPKVAFLFTGQGPQYLGMARQLYDAHPVFRETIDQCQEILRARLDIPLLEIIYPKDGASSRLNETAYTQPALFSIQYALAQLWRSWGIEPAMLLGHSAGEYAAGCVAGIYSLADGLMLACERGRLAQTLPPRGLMASLLADETKTLQAIAPYADRVAIAAINGPDGTVISGDREAVEAVLRDLEAAGIKTKRLNVSHAFHAPFIEPIMDEFERSASCANYSPPQLRILSSMTVQSVSAENNMNASYWRRHLRNPVRFADALRAVHEQGCNVFIEIGPSPMLLGLGMQCLPQEAGVWVPSLRKGQGDWEQLLKSLSDLYVNGVDVDWEKFDSLYSRRKVSLPLYPFQNERYWVETTNTTSTPQQVWRSLVQAGSDYTRRAAAELSLHDMPEKNRSMDLLCAAYMAEALQKIGAFVHPQKSRKREELLAKEFIQPRYRQLLGRWLDALVDLGHLRRQGDEYVDLQSLSPIDERLAQVRALWADELLIVDLVQRFGENLAAALTGKVDPLGLLFNDDTDGSAEAIYQSSGFSRFFSGVVRETLKGVVKSLPDESRLRILEIGAGTGGTTAWLLPDLPAVRTSYTFTDISKHFLQNAQQKFSAYPFVDYKLLDIQRHPEAQGFAPHQFDVVIAANVLHATRHLGEALHHARSLLAPHGLLIVWEVTKPVVWFDITFGLLLQELHDESLRHGQPFLSTQEWQHTLRASGFEKYECFPLAASQEDVIGQNIIVARADSSPASIPRAFSITVPAAAVLTTNLTDANVEAHAGHRLLGRKLRAALPIFETQLDVAHVPFLVDHRVYGMVVVPGSMYIEMALAAAAEAFGSGDHMLGEVAMQEAFILSDEKEQRPVQIILGPAVNGESSFQIFSLPAVEPSAPQSWKLHVSGKIRLNGNEQTLSPIALDAVQARCKQELIVHEYYRKLRELGFEAGESFQGITQLWQGKDEVLGKVALPEKLRNAVESCIMHPALLDAAFQTCAALLFENETGKKSQDFYMLVGMEKLRVYRAGVGELWCQAQLRSADSANRQTLIADLQLIDDQGNLVAEVQGYCLKRAERETLQRMMRGRMQQWLHEVSWRPKKREHSRRPQPSEPGQWLILADRSGHGEELAKILQENGDACLLAYPSVNGDSTNNGHLGLDATQPERFRRLLQQLAANDKPRLHGVAHLWSLDESVTEEMTTAKLRAQQAINTQSVLHLMQALTGVAWAETPRLWIVTRGAQPAGMEQQPLAVAHSPLWGFANTIALEHPELECVRVDLDPAQNDPSTQMRALGEEILNGDSEDQIAYRNNDRFVARLVRRTSRITKIENEQATSDERQATSALHAPRSTLFESEATYLITGGLSGIGLLVAPWMVENGARHLVLIGRSAPSAAAQEVVHEIEARGANVVVIAADVAREEEISRVFAQIAETMPPLRGIIHSAGVTADGLLPQQNWESFEKVLSPKVYGAWNLHTFSQNLDLEFFVLFSAGAALLGQVGTANYTAANAFLDALAHYRRSLGLPALSINWCPWANVGMAKSLGSAGEMKWQETGIGTIAPRQGLQMLEQMLHEDMKHIAVMPIDWRKYLRALPAGARSPLLSDLAEPPTVAAEKSTATACYDFLQQVHQAPRNKRRSMLLAHVREHAIKVLGLNQSFALDPQQGLTQLGMDSLMTVELKNRLQKSLGRTLPSTLVFDYPTTAALAEYLEKEALSFDEQKDGAVENDANGNQQSPAIKELDELSEEAAEAMLLEELSNT
jgi:acyl transferase domain-containing protein/SAM-dependent methyltransferase/acyl carrier protein